MTPLEIVLLILMLSLAIGFIAFAFISLREKHPRAAGISTLFTLLTLSFLLIVFLAPPTIQTAFAVILSAALLLSILLVLLPVGKDIQASPAPNAQIDERTIMFARARLQPGSPEYNSYYQEHPEHFDTDRIFRLNPGLLEPGAVFYDQLKAASPEASFFLTDALRNAVDGPVAEGKTARSPEEMTPFIKDLASYHGAVDVGVCRLQPYHIYSHIGRGTGDYGAPITLDHQFAIAISVEMAYEKINTAPGMPAVGESARQYVEAGKIAVILAAAIRHLGYPARAHIDGNYRVIAPLVAKDAGLGEIGRMGILITPRLGPRVRLSVVTTDLPLVPDQPTFNSAVIDFCSICKKCADLCPSGAIPFDDRQTYDDGTIRWKINPERCYTYWTKVGTDCGRCMAVCPYAHADHFMHSLIRFGVDHSGMFRRAAYRMDQLFYGKNPPQFPS